MPNTLVKLATSGLSAVAATSINGDAATGITAAGTTAANATPLPAANNFIGTAAASTGVLLPPVNGGDEFFVYNGGANPVLIYAPTGATINGGASLSLTNGKACYIVAASATLIAALSGA